MYFDALSNRINNFYSTTVDIRKNKRHLVVGGTPKKDALVLMSNDYLSIVNHPKIISAQVKELEKEDKKLIMSAVFMNDETQKSLFEREMAQYLKFESTILCQSGWAANVGLLQAIADKDVPVYIDFFAHMSLWDGIRRAGARRVPFLHNDTKSLEQCLVKYGPGIIIIDSIYSSIGDIAPIREIAQLAQRYQCVFVVDESHSLGTNGPQGAGLVQELGLSDQVDFITISLAKAFSGRAGLIACSKRFAGYFPYVSYPAIFSSTVLDYEIAGLRAALEVIKEADDRRDTLRVKSKYLRDQLCSLGYKIQSESHIVSIQCDTEEEIEFLRDALEERDIFGSIFCSPAVPKDEPLIRFSVNSGVTLEELDYLVQSLREIQFLEDSGLGYEGQDDERVSEKWVAQL